jgi:glutamyl-tRNA synthetase
MEITHVLRGFGWIPSIPKHILIHRAFGWEMPVYGHLTDILNPDGKGKLSKRFGAVAAMSFLEKGYLPEAVLNFLMLLGWSSPLERVHGEKERELFSLQEFVEIFDLKDLNKSNQRFDQQKLDWFNQKYIMQSDPGKLAEYFVSWLGLYSKDTAFNSAVKEKGTDYLQKVLALVQQRSRFLAEIPPAVKFLYVDPGKQDYSAYKKLSGVTPEQVTGLLNSFIEVLSGKAEDFSDFPHEEWEALVRAEADKLGLKAGDAFMVLRAGVAGSEISPPLYEAMQLLGKTEVLKRLQK